MSAMEPTEAQLDLALRRLGVAAPPGRRANPRRAEPEPLFDLHPDPRGAGRFEEFYGKPIRAAEFTHSVKRRSPRVTYLGDEGLMFKVTPAYVSPRPDNIFDWEKLGAVKDYVESGGKLVTFAPFASLSKIELIDVQESQEAHLRGAGLREDGTARPFTTGDDELDLYLGDPERAEEIERPDHPARWRAAMDRKAASAERHRRGDLGRYWARVRDGNHRLFGALLAGEPYAWVSIARQHASDYPPGLLK